VILHFAYGSNMSRAAMRAHAPWAQPLGVAVLAGYRFVITSDGYASIVPQFASSVYGVLWRLTPRDRATLAAWESVAAGLYRTAILPVRREGRRMPALTYIARRRPEGRAKTGYMDVVLAAALEWELPAVYIESLRRWLPQHSAWRNSRKLKEFGWT